MSVSWITAVYNNTAQTYYMWARDNAHLGVFSDESTGRQVGSNDDDGVLEIQPGARFRADWAGIPWYADDRHYRAVSSSSNDIRQALLFWQTKIENTDGVALIEGRTMKGIAHLGFGSDSDHRYALIINDVDGQHEIDLELRSTDDTRQRILNLVTKLVVDTYEDLREIRVDAAKAAVGAVVSD